MAEVVSVCEVCEGRRFTDEVLQYTLRDRNIVEVLAMPVEEARDVLHREAGEGRCSTAWRTSGWATSRSARSWTRSRAASASGSSWRSRCPADTAVYVLDEPTTGLHMQDVDNLVGLLDRLVDCGRTVIVIEHNLDVIARADWVIDLGPGGGHDGGRVIFEGTPADLVRAEGSLTGEHLRRRLEATAASA